MFEVLKNRLPEDVLRLIVIFEGRVTRAYLREYISQVYSGVYQSYFGRRHSLKYICGSNDLRFDRMAGLPFYAAWSSIIREKHPEVVKTRKCRKWMRKYLGLIPPKQLEKQRLAIEGDIRRTYVPRLSRANMAGCPVS